MIPLDQLQHLTYLVWLGLTANALNDHQFTDIRVDEDMVAALDATQMETKSFDQVDKVGKADIPGSVQYSER